MRREIRSHTGLRGIAAVLVVGYHTQFNPGYKLPFERPLFHRAYLMVDLFFILSGFVLSYVYYDRGKPLSAEKMRSFWLARFVRIYPLHVFALGYLTLFVLGTDALLQFAGKPYPPLGNPLDWLNQLLLLNAWFPAATEWNTPSWSISAEAFAYILFPFVIGRVTLLVAVSVAFYLWVTISGGSIDIIAGLAPLRCLAGFGLGIFIFKNRISRDLQRFQLAAVCWIMLGLAFPISDPLLIPGFVILVWSTWQDEGVLAKVLSSRLFHRLGEISYSVYLMHCPVLGTLWFLWTRLHLDIPNPTARILLLMIDLIAVLVVSDLTYRFVETPCRLAFKKYQRVATASP